MVLFVLCGFFFLPTSLKKTAKMNKMFVVGIVQQKIQSEVSSL